MQHTFFVHFFAVAARILRETVLAVVVRECLHEKTRTGASIIPGWLFDFVSRLHDDCWKGHFISRYLKVHVMLIKYTCDPKSQTLRIRHPFQSTADQFHTEAGGRIAFAWYRCEILYQSEILAPAQQPGWTHDGVTRTGMTFCGGII